MDSEDNGTLNTGETASSNSNTSGDTPNNPAAATTTSASAAPAGAIGMNGNGTTTMPTRSAISTTTTRTTTRTTGGGEMVDDSRRSVVHFDDTTSIRYEEASETADPYCMPVGSQQGLTQVRRRSSMRASIGANPVQGGSPHGLGYHENCPVHGTPDVNMRDPLNPYWTYCTQRLLQFFSDFVTFFALHAVKYPKYWLCAITLASFTLLTAGFFTGFKLELDLDQIFTPIGSRPQFHNQWIVSSEGFPEDTRHVQLIFHAHGYNVLHAPQARRVLQALDVIRTQTPGYAELCKQGIYQNFDDEYTCRTMSMSGFWPNHSLPVFDDTVGDDDDALRAIISGRQFNDTSPVVHDLIVGNYVRDPSTRILESAQSYMVQVYLPNKDDTNSFESNMLSNLADLRQLWMDEDADTPYEARTFLTVDMMTVYAFQLELLRTIFNDLWLVPICLFLMVSCTCLIFYQHGDRVQSRSMLGLASVATICMSVFTGFGIMFLFKIPYTAVHQILPFVIFGIGLDDTFIITGAYFRTDPNEPIEDRIRITMQEVGPSITLTTVTTIFAFTLGRLTSSLPGVHWLCVYAVTVIIFIFFYQITYFVAFLVLDERRLQANRRDCCFWQIEDREGDEADTDDDEPEAALEPSNNANGDSATTGTTISTIPSGSAVSIPTAMNSRSGAGRRTSTRRPSDASSSRGVLDPMDDSDVSALFGGTPVMEDCSVRLGDCLGCSAHIIAQRSSHFMVDHSRRSMVDHSRRSMVDHSRRSDVDFSRRRTSGMGTMPAMADESIRSTMSMSVKDARAAGIIPKTVADEEYERRRMPVPLRMMRWYSNFLMRPYVKIAVLVIFAAFFGLNCYSATLMKQHFNVADYVANDSYLKGVFTSLELYSSITRPMGVYFRDINQSDPDIQMQMIEFVNQVEELPQIGGKSNLTLEEAIATDTLRPFCWVRDLQEIFAEAENHPDEYIANTFKSWTFNERLDFLMTSKAIEARLFREVYGQDIVFDEDGNIKASRCYLFLQNLDLKSVTAQMDMLLDQRNVTQRQPLNQLPEHSEEWAMFNFETLFFYWEAFVVAVDELVMTIISGVIAVTVIAIIFIPHWSAAFFVFPIIMVLYIDMLGTIRFFGLDINGLTYICIVVAVGLLVDFLMHVLLRFYESRPDQSREDRVKETLQTMGVSILVGGFTTFLGVVPLCLSAMEVFKTVFYSFFAMVFLGLTHGLIVMPVILSYVGPKMAVRGHHLAPKPDFPVSDPPPPPRRASLVKHSARRRSSTTATRREESPPPSAPMTMSAIKEDPSMNNSMNNSGWDSSALLACATNEVEC
ncbi:Protein patched homolog 1 [Seminavis robusta]|uniref:Protein patched homolog 1 n=1 Tax=Seminavis robusta TaxID=568900 RepID=A0A9N8HM85_9STRA|nr:Protein patched homolog 1 [Seminavis robusta]|eukprot:Sro977_g227070.1 Protein patched homolog 1 (1312) ;mRNA; f:34713-38853